MADIRLNNLSKHFGGSVKAVDDLSLHIADGEFLVLLGPSGCGKTTTLRMIAGLEHQTDGDIYIGGRLVNGVHPGNRDIAFVFQFYALYPHLSVWDNIAFPLRAQSVPRQEVQRRVEEVARRLRISHILKRRPGRLPGGEQQRIALARAMIRQPQVFLMDEPLTNLDAALRADMRVELKRLQHELGTTMVYVTHDQVEAMSMSHRIAVMNNGILQQADTPLNIYNHPATLFVATFIGSPPMNVIPCEVAGEAGEMLAGKDNTFYILSAGQVAAVRASGCRDLVLGIRSEDIQLGDGTLTGKILVREPLGDETIYRIEMGGYQLAAKAAPRLVFKPGESISLHLNPERVHLFDASTGQSILKGVAVHG